MRLWVRGRCIIASIAAIIIGTIAATIGLAVAALADDSPVATLLQQWGGLLGAIGLTYLSAAFNPEPQSWEQIRELVSKLRKGSPQEVAQQLLSSDTSPDKKPVSSAFTPPQAQPQTQLQVQPQAQPQPKTQSDTITSTPKKEENDITPLSTVYTIPLPNMQPAAVGNAIMRSNFYWMKQRKVVFGKNNQAWGYIQEAGKSAYVTYSTNSPLLRLPADDRQAIASILVRILAYKAYTKGYTQKRLFGSLRKLKATHKTPIIIWLSQMVEERRDSQ